MPEATVEEDGDASAGEGHVRAHPAIADAKRIVDAIAKSRPMQQATHCQLGRGVHPAIALHRFSRRRAGGCRRGRQGAHNHIIAHREADPAATGGTVTAVRQLRAAEFFAGIGLMRLGLEAANIATKWANDIEPHKYELYKANFGDSEFVLADVRNIQGRDIPKVDVATASFPCTDLSLAGNRKGLGDRGAIRSPADGSSMFWEFARVLDEMGGDRPPAVLLENVLGFASSHRGHDLREAVNRLNTLGYSCDLLAIDARHFVPQSRPRMFIIGLRDATHAEPFDAHADRPGWVHRFVDGHPEAAVHSWGLPPLPQGPPSLARIVERIAPDDPQWWASDQVHRFIESLSSLQERRLESLRMSPRKTWRTAYRRTRRGSAVWEIRADRIAGCLRTARGGSSKQALVEAGEGNVGIRWMTPREYARLMGAPRFKLPPRSNQALFGFGDAVCVPVIRWLGEHYLAPAIDGKPTATSDLLAA
jgi:DNA (cytosine-5)-methyltransferase 1